MDILSKIVKDKREEVALQKSLIPIKRLEQSVLFNRDTILLSNNLRHSKTGIIAEHKRRSPSKAVINQSLNVQDVAKGYENAGVCGMSVLTDGKYFGGSLDDLLLARGSCTLPLLRKEFIIDEYQIIEAKSHGADVILLIAAILSRDKIKQYSELAKMLSEKGILNIEENEDLSTLDEDKFYDLQENEIENRLDEKLNDYFSGMDDDVKALWKHKHNGGDTKDFFSEYQIKIGNPSMIIFTNSVLFVIILPYFSRIHHTP